MPGTRHPLLSGTNWHEKRVWILAKDFNNELTLDDLIAEANEEYPNLIVAGVTFLNPLQMEGVQRKAFEEAAKRGREEVEGEDEEGEEDTFEYVRAVLVHAADDEVKAGALLEKIGDNMAVLNVLAKRYFALNQVGEA